MLNQIFLEKFVLTKNISQLTEIIWEKDDTGLGPKCEMVMIYIWEVWELCNSLLLTGHHRSELSSAILGYVEISSTLANIAVQIL